MTFGGSDNVLTAKYIPKEVSTVFENINKI
jgi:hypothetical protein